ncbi:MAG TPA: peptidoglycan-binding protein LysM [Chitinophagales bacterium]|nr:peptidoglycan-binding protein LysM [Chitinophagales bacterium]
MGLISVIKNAGSKIFGLGDSNEKKQEKIIAHLQSYQLNTEGVQVTVEDDKVHLSGYAKDIFDKIKIVATAGNIDGIAEVEDQLTVGEEVEVNLDPVVGDSQYYTVVKGDTLSKIAKHFYANANAYHKIFEANKPMLKTPDLIYPGQILIIPA